MATGALGDAGPRSLRPASRGAAGRLGASTGALLGPVAAHQRAPTVATSSRRRRQRRSPTASTELARSRADAAGAVAHELSWRSPSRRSSTWRLRSGDPVRPATPGRPDGRLLGAERAELQAACAARGPPRARGLASTTGARRLIAVRRAERLSDLAPGGRSFNDGATRGRRSAHRAGRTLFGGHGRLRHGRCPRGPARLADRRAVRSPPGLLRRVASRPVRASGRGTATVFRTRSASAARARPGGGLGAGCRSPARPAGLADRPRAPRRPTRSWPSTPAMLRPRAGPADGLLDGAAYLTPRSPAAVDAGRPGARPSRPA